MKIADEFVRAQGRPVSAVKKPKISGDFLIITRARFKRRSGEAQPPSFTHQNVQDLASLPHHGLAVFEDAMTPPRENGVMRRFRWQNVQAFPPFLDRDRAVFKHQT